MKKIAFVITVLCLMMCVIACQKACEHSYEPNVLVEASCDAKGLIAYNCTLCGYCRLEEKPMLAHSFGEPKLGKESTCAEEGEMHITCTVCGTHEVVEKIPVVEHKYLPKVTTTPTCTEEGVRTYTCSGCGDEYTEPINKTSHKYTSTITTAATCTKEGVKTLTCSYCRDQYTERIPAGNHSWTSANCTSAKKCSECGETSGSALGHSWKDATCTEAEKCSRCGKTSGSAKGHSWDKGRITNEPTCSVEGTITYSCKECGQTKKETLSSIKDYVKKNPTKVDGSTYTLMIDAKDLDNTMEDGYVFIIECNGSTTTIGLTNGVHIIQIDFSSSKTTMLDYRYGYYISAYGSLYYDVMRGDFSVSRLFDLQRLSYYESESTIGNREPSRTERFDEHSITACDLAQKTIMLLNVFLEEEHFGYDVEVFGFELN